MRGICEEESGRNISEEGSTPANQVPYSDVNRLFN